MEFLFELLPLTLWMSPCSNPYKFSTSSVFPSVLSALSIMELFFLKHSNSHLDPLVVHLGRLGQSHLSFSNMYEDFLTVAADLPWENKCRCHISA